MKRLLPYLVAALPAITSAQVDTFHASFKDLNGKSLPNVSILPYEGSPVIFTGNDLGLVTIPNYPGKTYEYRLTSKKSEPLNGLDVQDLVLLEALVNGQWKPSQPLNELAADVDQSQSVTQGDLKLLTASVKNGSALDFLSGVYGWRFLPANTPLSSTNPFNNLPAATDLTTQKGVFRLDMLGYKVGDLNGDARPEKLQGEAEGSRSAGILVRSQDQIIAAGATTTFVMAVEEPVQWYGLSVVVKTSDALELISVAAADGQLLKTQETQLSLDGQRGVYLGFQSAPVSMNAGKTLLSVTVKARTAARLSESVLLDGTQSYGLGGALPRFEKQPISLDWEALPTSAVDMKALPMTLHYELGTSTAVLRFSALEGPATLRLVQANGQVVQVISIAQGAVEQAVALSQLPQGLYWLQLTQGKFQGQVAMVRP